MSAAELSRLIGTFYDCPMTPQRWGVALAEICGRCESAAGTLAIFDLQTGQEHTLVNHGISEYYDRLYKEKYHCIDLFIHCLRAMCANRRCLRSSSSMSISLPVGSTANGQRRRAFATR